MSLFSYFTNPLVLIPSLIAILYFLKIYINGGMCRIKEDLKNKVIIITGSNTGIGKEAAKMLAQMNATIIFACRSEDRTQPIID
jgi:retinol dehydrogenase-12